MMLEMLWLGPAEMQGFLFDIIPQWWYNPDKGGDRIEETDFEFVVFTGFVMLV